MTKAKAASGAKVSLRDRLLNNSTLDLTSVLKNSEIFNDKDMVPTQVPMINVALSGRVDGGLTSGVTMLAGPSKHFKSGFALLLASSYLNKHEDAVMLFYDCEFGAPKGYFKTFGIDEDRVVYTPFTNLEELKFDLVKQLKGINRGDKVIIVIDSVGNVASLKEIEDAENEKSVADMSRAKQMKSLFRMVTPHMTLKDIPLIAINHTYKEIGMYPKDIVGGGTGSYYSSDTIWIIGRQQDKEKEELVGYNFVINIEKSRFVKEKSKIPITVAFESGIQRYAGLFDVAIDLGYIVVSSKGWYALSEKANTVSTENFRRSDKEYDGPFWAAMLRETDLKEDIRKLYQLTDQDILSQQELEEQEA